MLAKSLAKSLETAFGRIQFTPDLLPSDVTGLNFYNQKEGEFKFRKGPVFANIILADEINRATPRTQASLLECMEERQVTVDGETRQLEEPFFVIATQNPLETTGTFPLPEAQLDRFFMKLSMGLPDKNEEINIMKYIGATDYLVRAPFIIEGMLIGVIGAVIPLLIIYNMYSTVLVYIKEKFTMLSQLLEFLPVETIYDFLVPVSLLVGIGIGFLGSVTTVRKHIKV